MRVPDNVFVFGSNESGIHGAGAAAFAYHKKGAKLGQGLGLAGESFAIPTKDWTIGEVNTDIIEFYVKRFIEFAKLNPQTTFQVTAIGCGLAGYRHSDIAPMFRQAPNNCQFDLAWKPVLGDKHTYWGTF